MSRFNELVTVAASACVCVCVLKPSMSSCISMHTHTHTHTRTHTHTHTVETSHYVGAEEFVSLEEHSSCISALIAVLLARYVTPAKPVKNMAEA